MEIIGAGFGRTGTKSLQLALEQLGYNPCYHMEALFRNPHGFEQWNQAYKEEPVEWSEVLGSYKAIVDFPGAQYYRELADYYPEAKVILSVRDPESWYESARSTIYSFDPGPAIKIKMLMSMPFSATARNLFKAIQLNDKAIWKKLFEGKFEDRKFAIDKFISHNEEVKATISPDRLLVYEVGSGWEPICAFLGKEIPSNPYPSANKKENFDEWAKGIVRDVLS